MHQNVKDQSREAHLEPYCPDSENAGSNPVRAAHWKIYKLVAQKGEAIVSETI